jgi:uncharacterized membrane protein YdjX (TVP38/TMEM64 family)
VTSRTISRLALFGLLAAAAAIAFALRDRLQLAHLEAIVASAGVLGPLLYIALYALATPLFVPGTLFGLAGGALFGPVWGTVWNLSAPRSGRRCPS